MNGLTLALVLVLLNPVEALGATSLVTSVVALGATSLVTSAVAVGATSLVTSVVAVGATSLLNTDVTALGPTCFKRYEFERDNTMRLYNSH